MTCPQRLEQDEWYCPRCDLRCDRAEGPLRCGAPVTSEHDERLKCFELRPDPALTPEQKRDRFSPPVLLTVTVDEAESDPSPRVELERRARPDLHGMRQPALLSLRFWPGRMSAGPWPDTPRGRGELWDWASRLRR